MSPRRINPIVDTFRGINNALNPTSAQYRQFMAFDAQNSRINDSGIWDKAAALENVASGATQINLPGTASGTHFKELFIKGVQKIVGALLPTSKVDVGPNKYAYFSEAAGQVYWWDGVARTVDTNYGKAGLGRPTANATASITNMTADGQTVTVTAVNSFTDGEKVTITNTTDFNEANVTVTDRAAGLFKYTSGKTFAGPDYGTDEGMAIRGIGVAANFDSLEGGRMQRGTYYYMYTYFDIDKQVESLPSTVTDWVCSAWPGTSNNVDSAIYPTLMASPDAGHSPSTGDNVNVASDKTMVRFYRTKRTYEPDRDINAPNEFFFIGEVAYLAAGISMDDLAHDSELVDMYEGRGSPPPAGVELLVSFENRMYYFVGNVVHWSSSGRPGEVAQEYTLTYETRDPAGGASLNSTFPMLPVLAGQTQGEAKYEISEFAGQTIIGAYPYNGKLWVWTNSMCGYLRPTLATEGIRFHFVRRGLGLISDKTLAHTPYGLFGADREGVWLLDNNNALGRLSKGIIDIDDSTKSTYFEQGNLTASFGVWVPALSEYWWCTKNLNGEADDTYVQLAYQPLRRIFGGIYDYTLTGGCAMTTAGGAQSYLTGGKTPSATAVATDRQQQLDFWMGQHSLETIKDNLKVEIVYESITANKEVTVDIYQNQIASTTGAQSDLGTKHTDSSLVGTAHGHHSGRMFLVRISTDDDATRCPIIAINYTANHLLWSEKHAR